MPIRNPIEWGVDQFKYTIFGVESANRGLLQTEADARLPLPVVRRITVADLREVLAQGASDFGANRTDVIFLCVLYPVIGVVLASLAAGHHMLPLLFPLASGFALIGPFAGVGLNEISRRRELGIGAGWTDAFRVLSSPSLGAIILLGLVLTTVFFFWLVTAYAIYDLTMGPWLPASPAVFIHDVLLTRPGRELIVVGVGVGFLFAAVVLVISVVAFPLLLDRTVGVEVAVRTSVRAAIVNPGPIFLWGLIVTGGLVIGSIPVFVGLIVVLPVLGHSTWHLYRKMVVPR
ncbi:MAG: hypothetical protein QOF70_925 [Acetobacteraceae bacterium]|jgi:uncharacterized membrane protein|nr:hypothetical protein [Acetobacteraceae bacterium]